MQTKIFNWRNKLPLKFIWKKSSCFLCKTFVFFCTTNNFTLLQFLFNFVVMAPGYKKIVNLIYINYINQNCMWWYIFSQILVYFVAVLDKYKIFRDFITQLQRLSTSGLFLLFFNRNDIAGGKVWNKSSIYTLLRHQKNCKVFTLITQYLYIAKCFKKLKKGR